MHLNLPSITSILACLETRYMAARDRASDDCGSVMVESTPSDREVLPS